MEEKRGESFLNVIHFWVKLLENSHFLWTTPCFPLLWVCLLVFSHAWE